MASATKVIGPSQEYYGRVKSGSAATIGQNDIVIVDPSNPGYVSLMGSGASGGDSDEAFVGMAITESTETASADGFVKFLGPQEGCTELRLEMKADTASNLARALVGTKVRSATATKGAQTLDENEVTKGIFRILDPVDNKFDTVNGRMRVSLPCVPWGTSSNRN